MYKLLLFITEHQNSNLRSFVAKCQKFGFTLFLRKVITTNSCREESYRFSLHCLSMSVSAIEIWHTFNKLFTLFQIFNMNELAIWQFLRVLVFLRAPRWTVPPNSASRTAPQGCSMSAPVSLSSLTCFLNCCRNMMYGILHSWSYELTTSTCIAKLCQRCECCRPSQELHSGPFLPTSEDKSRNIWR